ncbi:MAG TPA: MraY family glycosyltransferase, partial [Thermoanaerobaculia bacterium]|nr:MraY family glycosyltransferase [Thermoanaerobaculia bacterium]
RIPYSLLLALAAFALTFAFTPLVRSLAFRIGALDRPGPRRVHAEPVPSIGGLAFAVAILITLYGAFALPGPTSLLDIRPVIGLSIAAVPILLLGLLDDLRGTPPWLKLVVQASSACILYAFGYGVPVLTNPFGGSIGAGVLNLPLTVLWVVVVINAINLIDGLDGLAGGVVAIIAVSLLGYAVIQGSPGSVVLMAATAGACVGFLRHNWEPARIFMGDSGSLTLGYLLAGMTVHSSLKAPATVAILVPILALGVPVMDTLLVMAVRFLDRPQGPLATRFLRMFHADRNHLHHLLAHFGGKRSRIVAVIYAVVLSFCGLALLVAVTGQDTLGVALVALEFAIVLGMRQMGLAMAARRLASQQREEVKAEVLGLPSQASQAAPPSKPVPIRRLAS